MNDDDYDNAIIIRAESAAERIQNNPALSYTALGLWSFLFCQPWAEGTWPNSTEQLARLHPGNSAEEIDAALAELQAAGILKLRGDE